MADTRFTAADRHIADEERVQFTSVGVDIGSSTSHLVFSHLELERRGTRYVTVERTILSESEVLLTPYADDTTIDADALGRFIARQYEAAGLRREEVDTCALIMTGVALQRRNARAIGELFAQEAGRFVAVSAGDSLEASLAAHGSGAVALSLREGSTVLNVDVGGGTTKLAVCSKGAVQEVAALDVGARLVVVDRGGIIVRLEKAGRRIGEAVGLDIREGRLVGPEELKAMASYMAERLIRVVQEPASSAALPELLRTPPLTHDGPVDAVVFSGGVAEFIHGREAQDFGDLGELLGEEIRARAAQLGVPVSAPGAGIRATVIGASQYTVQVSGNTIFLSPPEAAPLRNLPVVAPQLPWDAGELEPAMVERAVREALGRLDLLHGESAVALAVRWRGSATLRRIHGLCSGIVDGLREGLAQGNPVVLACDGDVGGLLGIHLKEEMRLPNPVISVDGVEVGELDYIDIGSLIPASGAVPVIIKSLIFPAPAGGPEP